MKTYPDTSFLCALYRTQENSPQALAYRRKMPGPLIVTRLLLWEFRQSVRFQAFRHSKDPSVGYPLAGAEKMISDLGEDLDQGLVVIEDVDILSVMIIGDRVSKTRTFTGGHRSFDILHVSTALALDADAFLSFDSNQNSLAIKEGMAAPLNRP